MPQANIEQSEKNDYKKRKKAIERISLIIPFLAILGIILSLVGYRESIEKVQLEHFKEEFEIDAANKLTGINSFINKMVQHLEIAANAVSEYNDFTHPDIKRILEFSNASNWFSFTSIVDAEGNGYDNAGHSLNVADREYFKTAMSGEVAFSEVMPSKVIEGDFVQIVAHPIRTETDEVRGAVLGVLNVDKIEEVDFNTRYKHKGNAYIVDSCGEYIAKFEGDEAADTSENFWSDLKRNFLKEEELNRIKAEFESRSEGEISYSYNGKRRYACHMPIGPNKWQLVYSVSKAPIDDLILSMYQLDTKNTILAWVCNLVLLGYIIWRFQKTNRDLREAHQQAQRNMEFMQLSIEHSKNILFEYDQTARKISLKTSFKNRLFKHREILFVPESFWAMNKIAPASVTEFERLFREIENESSSEAEIQLTDQQGEIWYRISMNNIYDDKNRLITTVGIAEDISALKKRELQMNRKLQIQNTLIANALLYAKVDLKTDTLLELNGEETHAVFHEFAHQRIIENVCEDQIAYVEQELSLEVLNRAYQQGKESVEVQFLRKEGCDFKWVSCIVYRIYMDDSSKVLFVVTDIDERKRSELALRKQAERDGLTGLYNAATTRFKINEELASQHALNENQIFILIDLDNYKLINDTFGHDYGDHVLIDIASILKTRFRSSDIVGRLGGDEFIVLLRDVKSQDYAEHLIDELCKSINKTYREGNDQVVISASVGMAMAPNDGNTFEELYKKADTAQYEVKKGGKNGFKRYQ